VDVFLMARSRISAPETHSNSPSTPNNHHTLPQRLARILLDNIVAAHGGGELRHRIA
jgi:hypothetical protein